MALTIDARFEGNLTCAFKNDMRNLANFHQRTFESLKMWTFDGSFYPKQKKYYLKIYRGDNLDFNGLLLTKVYNV